MLSCGRRPPLLCSWHRVIHTSLPLPKLTNLPQIIAFMKGNSQRAPPFTISLNFRQNDWSNWEVRKGGGAVEENGRANGDFGNHWTAVVRAYCELMNEVMPHLPLAEQCVYQRLFRLSHVQQSPFTKSRYEDVAAQCGVSVSTVRRAVKGLRTKHVLKSVWESKS